MEITRTATYSLHNTFPTEMAATIALYRAAVECLALIIRAEWETLAVFSNLDQREHAVERLVITTAPRKRKGAVGFTTGNRATYPCFEHYFGNMPCYLRRAAIRDALGLVASHNTRFRQWQHKQQTIVASDKTARQKKTALAKLGRPPAFQAVTRKTPALYRGNQRKLQHAVGKGRYLNNRIAGVRTAAGGVLVWTSADHAALKLYNGTAWAWYCVKLKQPRQDRFPVAEGWVEGTPTLVATGGNFEIHISMTKQVLYTARGTGKPVLAVDLGLNTRATAAVMTADGTILDRVFIDLPLETGRLHQLLGKIALGYKRSGQPVAGRRSCRTRWRKVRQLTEAMAHRVAAQLCRLAVVHDCEAVVFEHLGKLRVPRDFYGAKRLRKKLHYWLQGRIQRYTRAKCQLTGIRFARVLARGTSAEAFDGSGPVVRTGNCKVARFRNGGQYDADLSAAYNIAARYWIRQLHEQYPAAQVHDDAVVVAAVGRPHRRTAKAGRGNAPVTGQGTACPTAGPDVRQYVTGVPVARHRQTLASLISLNHWVSTQGANTRQGRMHATVESSPAEAAGF